MDEVFDWSGIGSADHQVIYAGEESASAKTQASFGVEDLYYASRESEMATTQGLFDLSTVFSDNTTRNNGDDASGVSPVAVLLLIVFVIGMIGNFLVIFVILILGEYKRVLTHWYVLQLAIADTIFLLTIPFRVAEDIHNQWIFPQWMCKAKETMFFLNYYASISFLVLMTIDRYIAICQRFSRNLQKFRTRRVTYTVTVSVWIVSILICIPAMMYSAKVGTQPTCKCEFLAADTLEVSEICLGKNLRRGSPQFKRCMKGLSSDIGRQCKKPTLDFPESSTSGYQGQENPGCNFDSRSDAFKAIIFFNFIVMFIIPFIIMSVCYTLIALQLHRSKIKSYPVPQNGDGKDQSSETTPPVYRKKRTKSIVAIKDNQNRNRVTTMCVCLVVLFVSCWFPFHAVHLAKMRGINEDEEYCENLFHIAFIIAYFSVSSHSALNPCLYNFLGAKSENKLKSAASSVRKTLRKSSAASTSTAKFRISGRSSTDAGYVTNVNENIVEEKRDCS